MTKGKCVHKNSKMKMLIFLILAMLYFPTPLYSQSRVISEIMADTCITFIKPNSNNSMSIQRNNESLCAFLNGISYTRPTAWNRTFSCRISVSNYSVCFSDTMTSDAGEFNFIVGNIQGNTATLDVEYPPTVLPMGTHRTIEGRNLSVTCSSTFGKPTATTVYWTKTDSEFRFDDQILWILNIEREDSGTYVCHVENTYSSGNKGTANATIEIDVQYPPSIQPFDTQKPVEGTTLVIPCNVHAGNPADTSTQWTRDGVSFNQPGASLVLSAIERSQSGTYVCMAQNTYFDFSQGEDNQSVTVDVEYPPSVSTLGVQYPTELSDLHVYCSATPGNPPNHVYYWTRSGDDTFRQNGTYLGLYGISRNETGSYICTAVNSYSTAGEGKDSQTLAVNVQYPPVVSPLPNVKCMEGEHVQITCNVTVGNPPSTTIYWTKLGDSEIRESGSTLVFSNVSRNQSGRYSCVAENNYLNGGKGNDDELFVLDVLYGPTFSHGQTLGVFEGQSAQMTTSITSNPASNVSWFRDNLLLSTQQSVNGTTSYTITRTQCTDTGSFQVVASNGVQSNYSTTVSLYVFCSPRLATGGDSVELSVGSNRYLYGPISVLSYPQPSTSLTLPSGAPNTLITLRIDGTKTNLFTVTLTKSILQSNDFGTYVLNVANQYGTKTIYVNIFPRGKPFPAAKVLVICGHGQALVTWQTSYFGYDVQYSVVQYSTDNVRFINGSHVTTENTKEEILQTSVRNLQDSTHYFFRVFTTNTYGVSTSMPINCSTATPQESSSSTSEIVGSVLGTLLLLAVGAVGFISYKYLTVRKDPKRSYDSIEMGKTIVNNHTYDTYDKQEGLEGTPRHSKTKELNPFKTKALQKEICRKTNYYKFKSLDGADTKKSISTDSNPTKTIRGERVYENITDVSSDPRDLNRGKTSVTRVGGPQKESSKETKTKPIVPPKPKT